MTEGFAAGGAGISEIEVFHHDRRAIAVHGLVEQCGDRRADPPIAVACPQAGSGGGDRRRRTDRVPAGIQHAHGEVISVEIHTEYVAVAPFVELTDRGWCSPPGGVQIPAGTLRVECDVVAHRSAIGNPLTPLLAAVVEHHRHGDLQMRAELVGQSGRDFDPQLTVRVDADRFITTRFSGFTVSGQEHARGVPPIMPLPLGHPRSVEVITGAPQPVPAHRDRGPGYGQGRLGFGEPRP